MRIALLTDGIFPYVIGGMQKHSYFLVKELARLGHTIHLFHCNESSFDAAKLELFTEEEKKYINPRLLSFPHKRYFPFHYLYESYTYSQAIYRELEPMLPEIDFVFAQGFCAWALLEKKNAMATAQGFPPVAVHFHGLEMFQNIPSIKAAISKMPLQRVVKRNIRLSDYSVSYGGKITTIMSRIADREKIWEVPAGVEDKWLKGCSALLADNKTRFVFIGRNERRKGVHELNAAIKSIIANSSGAGFSFHFIGDIPDYERISDPSLIYHGRISSEREIQNILSGCHVLVCPSYAEGMPNVILEAMACGLAVIATDVGAVSLLVGNNNGWLIERPSPPLIADAMLLAMQNKEALAGKKKKSAEIIKDNFLIEKVTRRLIDKMEAACNANKIV